MKNLHFKDCFWSSDLICTGGYDVIVQYLNDGRRTCKEVEDFIKARAFIEERYAKDLLGLSKKVCGHNEMNTLKRSLDMFKLQMEHVSLSHIQLAQNMREEAKKLEEFREKQKECRKKIEQHMDSLHKLKLSHSKKTLDSKKTYEHKCRDKEEVDQNLNRYKNTNNTKQMEKLSAKAQQAKLNADEADRTYQQNVASFATLRSEWMKEHVNACEVFEKQATERIHFLRNTVWTHVNQLSQQSVTSDELNEEVRKSLSQCDVHEDIEHFVALRQTGDKPAAAVTYENFYSGQRSVGAGQRSPLASPACRKEPPAVADSSSKDDEIYATVQEPAYSMIQF